MSQKVSNLGKVYCKVELYDRLLNINYDNLKLRQPVSYVLGTQAEVNYKRDSFGIQYLSVAGPLTDEKQTACIIPLPCYEPVNNYMDGNQSAASSSSNNIYWKQLSSLNKKGVAATDTSSAVSAGTGGISGLFGELVNGTFGGGSGSASSSKGLFDTSKQHWENSSRSDVSALKYREEEYVASGLKFNSSGTSSSVSSMSSAGDGFVTVESKQFVSQTVSDISTWWGITSKDQFFMPGGGFWVNIHATPTYMSAENDITKTCYLAIKIAEIDSHDILFVIDNRGRTMVVHSWEENKTRYIPVNLPHLSYNFQNGLEIKVGFLIACGRIFVYCDKSQYESVTIQGKETDKAPFIYHATLGKCKDQTDVNRSGVIDIYGYGCLAQINVCEMTFFKKSWFILRDLDGNIPYKGYKSPVEDTNLGGDTVKEGTYAPGKFVNWNISKEQYDNNGNNPMYAAQFEYYSEQDLTVDPNTSSSMSAVTSPNTAAGVPATTSVAKGLVYTKTNGGVNWWGGVYIVRSPDNGLLSGSSDTASNTTNEKKMYFCYMETYDWTDSSSITHKSVRFPIVYNIFANRPMVSPPEYTAPDLNVVDVTDDVMNVDIDYSLDNAKPAQIIKKATVTLYDSGKYNLYLTRSRGIKIWLKWSTSGTPGFSDIDIAFTGVAFGERASLQPGKNTITLNCSDYWTVLDRTVIKNSPFYDGFELFSVIKDLGERAGIVVENDVDHSGSTSAISGSSNVTTGVPFYFLGSGFCFDKPAHRYERNQNIKDCMLDAIKAFPYYMWFDHEGKMQVSVVPGNFDFSCVDSAQFDAGWDYSIKGWYYRKINNLKSESPYKLILNELQMNSNLKEGVFNSFMVWGVERTQNTPIIVTDSNKDSLTNPDSIGFLGFVSDKVIQQPALDSQASVQQFMNRYKTMYTHPGFETSITTVGHIPKYTSDGEDFQTRCGHFIQILQDVTPSNERFRITQITHKYDAEKNDWYTTIGAYQITIPGWQDGDDSGSSS